MHQERIYVYGFGEGPLAAWDPRLKCALLGAYLGIIAFLPRGGSAVVWLQFATLAGILALTMIAGQLRIRSLLVRSLIVLPFVLFLVLAEACTVPAAESDGWRIPGTRSALGVSNAGLERAAAVLARAWLSVLATLVLVSTTSVSRLLRALESLRVPQVLVLVIGLVQRYLWVVRDEMRRLLGARRLRTFRHRQWLRWREGTAILSVLFVRSLDRSSRIHRAMLLRGFRGRLPAREDLAWTRDDSRRLALGAAGLGLAVLLPLGWVAS